MTHFTDIGIEPPTQPQENAERDAYLDAIEDMARREARMDLAADREWTTLGEWYPDLADVRGLLHAASLAWRGESVDLVISMLQRAAKATADAYADECAARKLGGVL